MAENSFKRARSFRNVVAQYEAAYMTAYQSGYTVPATPEYYRRNLAGEAPSQSAWVEWAEPQDVIDDLVFQSVLKYSIFFGQQVAAPLPNNPTAEFLAWYNSVHPGVPPVTLPGVPPFVGTVAGQ